MSGPAPVPQQKQPAGNQATGPVTNGQPTPGGGGAAAALKKSTRGMTYDNAAQLLAPAAVEAMLKGAIAKTVMAPTPTPTPPHPGRPRGDVDVQQAYQETYDWTMDRFDQLDDDRAVTVNAELDVKYQAAVEDYEAWEEAGRPERWNNGRAPVDPGELQDYRKAHFFKAYWMERCLQFTDAMSARLPGPKYATLQKLIGNTNKALEQGVDPATVKGRTTIHRGKTLAQVAADEQANPRLAIGASVHVKLHFQGDKPYEYEHDFHHWLIWAGNGLFTDSLTGAEKSGETHDQVLRGWVRSKFSGARFRPFHGDPDFSQATEGPGTSKPKPNLQPLVSDEYDPRLDPAQEGDPE